MSERQLGERGEAAPPVRIRNQLARCVVPHVVAERSGAGA